MRSGIYFILNKVSLKLYIGSAVYLVKRRSEHFTRLAKNNHHNEHLQRAYNLYGANAFDFIIIEFLNISDLYEREKYFITKHRATEEEFGYNKSAVGSGMTGRKHSKATKEKMRLKRLGTKHSLETREKITKIVKGRTLKPFAKSPLTKEHKANISKGMRRNQTPLVLTQPPIIIGK